MAESGLNSGLSGAHALKHPALHLQGGLQGPEFAQHFNFWSCLCQHLAPQTSCDFIFTGEGSRT